MNTSVWTKETYERSVSSRCWWYTPYGPGWDESCKHGVDLSGDDDLRQIVAMEQELGAVPDWAQRIAAGPLNFLPPCGHYAFPQAYLDVVSAIGSQTLPPFIQGCYTADRERKERMTDYVFCLDAWLAGVGPEVASRELLARKRNPIDWSTVCAGIWQVLGERTELKELLIERTLHRQRWWIKSLAWADDTQDVFGRDHYLGDLRGSGPHYGNPAYHDPYLVELKSPRVQALEAKLAEGCPDWPWFHAMIRDSWLCAPKAFRFLERLLWSIGQERPAVALPSHPLEDADAVPGFLQGDDTYLNQDAAADWWRLFCAGLRGWWQRDAGDGPVAADVRSRLGETTPVKRWLVRLLVRKLELYEDHAELGRFVRPQSGGRRGLATVA